MGVEELPGVPFPGCLGRPPERVRPVPALGGALPRSENSVPAEEAAGAKALRLGDENAGPRPPSQSAARQAIGLVPWCFHFPREVLLSGHMG